MSDKWEFFPCTMGENQASIFVDIGIKETINEQAPGTLVKAVLLYKQPDDRGLPTSEEYESVCQVEDSIKAFAQSHSDWYVGRITVNGQRHFFIYASDPESRWNEFLAETAEQSGYQIKIGITEDPKHAEYWDYLYPTLADWQIIRDTHTLDAFKQQGDDLSATRQIDHWAYFDSAKSAQQFIDWALQNGFESDADIDSLEDKYRVLLFHSGSLMLADISHHTIKLATKANELGGDYDGWEAPVMKQDDSSSA